VTATKGLAFVNESWPFVVHERCSPKKQKERRISVLSDIEVSSTSDRTKIAREVFDALAQQFPRIADCLFHRGLTEHETAATLHWHVKSLRRVLSDYRHILRRARIATIEQWQQLVHQPNPQT
jgi:hypothetical protein